MLTKFYDVYGVNTSVKQRYSDDIDFNCTYLDKNIKSRDKVVCWSFINESPKEMNVFIGKCDRFYKETGDPLIFIIFNRVCYNLLQFIEHKGLLICS